MGRSLAWKAPPHGGAFSFEGVRLASARHRVLRAVLEHQFKTLVTWLASRILECGWLGPVLLSTPARESQSGAQPPFYLRRIKGTAEEASGRHSDPALGFDAAGGAVDLFATEVDHSIILVPQVLGAAIWVPTSGVEAFVFH